MLRRNAKTRGEGGTAVSSSSKNSRGVILINSIGVSPGELYSLMELFYMFMPWSATKINDLIRG